MKRRTFFGVAGVGLIGAGTCSWWRREPDAPLDLLSLTSQQSRSFVPAEVGTELWAVLRIVVDEGPAEDRPPVHVALVIDTSASMEGAAIEAARAAAAELVRSLQDGDRLSVVTFHSKAEVIVPSVEIDDDARDRVLERVAAIEARGTTDLAWGLAAALDDLAPHAVAGRVTRVVLLSDGVPNDPRSIPGTAARASAAGITVTTLGFGLDYDEALLASIAQQTGGTFHFLEEPAALVPIFRDENARLQGIAAQEIVLTLTTGPNVELREVVGQAYGLPQPRSMMALGDLSRGEERVVVVRLSVGPHPSGSTVELLDGVLTYREPRTGQMLVHDVFLSAKAEDDAAVLAESIDPSVDRQIENAKAAALTLHAVALSRAGNQVDAAAVLGEAAPAVWEAGNRLEDDALRDQAQRMDVLANALENEHAAEGAAGPQPLADPQTPVGRWGGGGLGGKAPRSSPEGERALRQAHSGAVGHFQARRNDE